MERRFPAFLAKEKALTLERLRTVIAIDLQVWRSWGENCTFNTKRILNFLRDTGAIRRTQWHSPCRVAVNDMQMRTVRIRNEWKSTADIAVRKMAQEEFSSPPPLWRMIAIREASRMEKSTGLGKEKNCKTWSLAFANCKSALNHKNPSPETRERWHLSARLNERGRFSGLDDWWKAYRRSPYIQIP